jgi:hypothetical protein
VVLSTAESDSEFVRLTQARRSLSSIKDNGFCSRHSIHVLSGRGGNSRHSPEKIQRRPFASQKRTRWSIKLNEYCLFLNKCAFSYVNVESDFFGQLPKDFSRYFEARHDAGLLGNDLTTQRGTRGDNGIRGGVAWPNIFLESTSDALLNSVR